MVAALHTGTSSSANTGASARNKEASPKCALQVPAGTALTRTAANPNPAHRRQRLAAVWGRRAGFLACNWLSALSINDCCGSFSRVREREREGRAVGGRRLSSRVRSGWWAGGRRRAGETVGGRERGSEGAGARSHIHVHAEPAREGKGKKKGGGSGGSRRLLKWPEAHMVLPVPGEWKASSSAAIPLPFLLLRQLLLLLLVLTAPLLMD